MGGAAFGCLSVFQANFGLLSLVLGNLLGVVAHLGGDELVDHLVVELAGGLLVGGLLLIT